MEIFEVFIWGIMFTPLAVIVGVLLYIAPALLRGESLGPPLGEEQWPYGEPMDYTDTGDRDT